MENTCRNCEYWAEKENSTGCCELKPQVQDYYPEDTVLDYNPENNAFNNGSYEITGAITNANDSCEDFEPRYAEAEQVDFASGRVEFESQNQPS